ncbi:mannose-1-phosphate guanylyltransferase/mannose-6-phosphate isomerase [Aeromonas media]|uniref:mannose-1-phosphate guanylyltransferase/mannose-6-phosphate isomerase n=1 Tax=Aeromonas media TaxID=651 RepID=UPI0030DD4E74
MSSESLLPVIMAGGSGTRLWPLSRTFYPKQFLTLTGSNSMLQDTVARLQGLEHQAPVLICNEEHRFIVAEQLRQRHFAHSGIILEPAGRNTAPAIALAALHATAQGDDPLLLVLAADHVIQNQANFIQAVQQAIPQAAAGKLVTFGIVPHAPETGYGYIRQGKAVSAEAYQVAAFVEKPDLATAEAYLASKEYYWNSGMFLFRASRYLAELELHRPDILAACRQAMQGVHHDLDFLRLNEAAFLACPDDSIDYAVMEKTKDAVVVPMDAQSSDVGSWSALWAVNDKDQDGNAIRGDVLTTSEIPSFLETQIIPSVRVYKRCCFR